MKKTEMRVQILSILNELPTPEAISLIESIGKRLRQSYSVEVTREASKFAAKNGLKKDISHYPINGVLNG